MNLLTAVRVARTMPDVRKANPGVHFESLSVLLYDSEWMSELACRYLTKMFFVPCSDFPQDIRDDIRTMWHPDSSITPYHIDSAIERYWSNL